MVVINAIIFAWVNAIGGVGVVYNIYALLFVFMIGYVFYRITTL